MRWRGYARVIGDLEDGLGYETFDRALTEGVCIVPYKALNTERLRF